jgi:hypothetical protein
MHDSNGTPLMTAPIASGWSGRLVRFAPTGKRRLCTAHAKCGHAPGATAPITAKPDVSTARSDCDIAWLRSVGPVRQPNTQPFKYLMHLKFL